MKKTYILIAVAIVAALSMAGCKNNNKKSQEPTQEEIQAQKQALADSVLAAIDALAEEYVIASENSFSFRDFELTETEKMVKPDYLLDPSVAGKFFTRSQKINALAIYLCELAIRETYEMPVDKAKEAVIRLAADINYPIELEKRKKGTPKSETIREEYIKCKDNGDLSLFWQFNNAVLTELQFIIANNPNRFFDRITEEQWRAYLKRWGRTNTIIEELSKYDDEMSEVWKFRKETRIPQSYENRKALWVNVEDAKQTFKTYKDKIIARRNALLQ